MAESEGGAAPVSPPEQTQPLAAERPRRKPPQRGKAGGRTFGQTVWFTDGERSQLQAKAAEAGLSAASYLRAAALGDAGPRARRSPTFDKELLGSGIVELNRVGNNVNQIARAGNIGKDVDGHYYRAVGDELRAVLALIRNAFFT